MAKIEGETLTNAEAMSPEIEEFLDVAANATLFHRPSFLAYHAAEKLEQQCVRFCHSVFRRRGGILAFLPGALVTRDECLEYHSPWGASVGGIAIHPDARFAEIEEIVRLWRSQLSALGAHCVKVTLTPPCYQRQEAQEAVEFIMLREGFHVGDPNLMLTARVETAASFPGNLFASAERRDLELAAERGCTARTDGELKDFWPLLCDTMERHGTTATHTQAELCSLVERFPDKFRFLLAEHQERPVAGMLLIDVTPEATTTFYICSRQDARDLKPVNLLIFVALEWARDHGRKWLDYGPSSFGLEPHHSLIQFKQQHGGRPLLRRTMYASIAAREIA